MSIITASEKHITTESSENREAIIIIPDRLVYSNLKNYSSRFPQ